jgi:hypothetical protein
VNQFIEECRREWRRLRVPKALADDMAAELETDLAEAAAEGISPAELVGTDGRSFAQSWAGERGIRRSSRRSLVVLAVLALLVCLATVGATLAISAPRSSSPAEPITLVFPPPKGTVHGPIRVKANPADVRYVSSTNEDDTIRTVGFILLVAGLGGAAVVTAVSLTTRRRHVLRF